MLRELGFLAHVFCWFHDVSLLVVASIRFLPSWLRFPWFYSVPQNKSRVSTSVWCWPLSDSAVIRKEPLLWIHYGRLFTLYRIDSVRLTSRCNWTPTPTFWTYRHFLITLEYAAQVVTGVAFRCCSSEGATSLFRIVSLTQFNISTWPFIRVVLGPLA